jgi:inward rectifier potassium channel
MSTQQTPRMPTEDEIRDLGFGAVVARESRQRLLNRDGSFNVARKGLGWLSSLSLYQALLTMPWLGFLGLVVAAYLLTNALFAGAYLLCGPGALSVAPEQAQMSPLAVAFFFSVETLATIGYGHITPATTAASVVMTLESLVGLLGFALATGILFARFSRPTAKILFSRKALIAPYRGGSAFEFRIANERSNQLIEVEAKVLFSHVEGAGEARGRHFHELSLERQKVAFFPLAWTVVHPIDERSPLWGMTPQRLRDGDAEFLILLTGIDETFSQTVHARSSYKFDEVVWQARFGDVFNRPTDGGPLTIDVSRVHAIERVGENG